MNSRQKPYQALKGANRSGIPAWGRALYLLLLATATASLFLWAGMDFDLNNGWLTLIGVVLGIFIGYLSSWILVKLVPGFRLLPTKGLNKLRILYIGIFISLTPFLLQKWNKSLGGGATECDAYQVLEKSSVSTRRSSARTIRILRHADRETVYIVPTLHARIQVGDTLHICIRTGALGFEYVTGVSN